MKTLKIFLIATIVLSISQISNAQLQKAAFQASGLTCSMCSNAINKALKTVPFIETVTTDLNKNIFEVVFKKGEAVDLDAIKKKVEGAGFSVAKFWITADLHDQKISNDQHISIDGLNFDFMSVKAQTLNGTQRLQVIDKDYIPSKEFKKYSASTTMPCYQTGVASDCCKSKDGTLDAGSRIYHVTI